jgi:hypothetical protein
MSVRWSNLSQSYESATTFLAGQYHGWDTAHDWSFGGDLQQGKPMNARARMIYKQFTGTEEMFQEIHSRWEGFLTHESPSIVGNCAD